MKKTIILALMAMAIVAVPATSQTRKEKKAAKKAEWEMQQQQKAEEAALLHQMKMDSIRDAQAAREAAKAEAEAKRAAEKAEQEYLKSAQTYKLPCWEPDTKEYFTAQVQRVMPLNQVTIQSTALLRLAKQQMQQKIAGAYKQVIRDYMDQMDLDDKFTAASHIESAGEMIINQIVNNTEESCREMTRPDASGQVTLYLAIKVSKENLVKEILNNIPEKEKKEVLTNEEEFRKEVSYGLQNAGVE